MTEAQERKLKQIEHKLLHHYENTTGDVVVFTRYGSKYFCRYFVGPRGGTTGHKLSVFKEWDAELKKPFGLLFTEYL